MRRVKIASGKDNYMFVFLCFLLSGMGATDFCDAALHLSQHRNPCTTITFLMACSTTTARSPTITSYKITPTRWYVRTQAEQQLTVNYKLTNYHHWRINDGGSLNDGSKCFDACIIEEEI